MRLPIPRPDHIRILSPTKILLGYIGLERRTTLANLELYLHGCPVVESVEGGANREPTRYIIVTLTPGLANTRKRAEQLRAFIETLRPLRRPCYCHLRRLDSTRSYGGGTGLGLGVISGDDSVHELLARRLALVLPKSQVRPAQSYLTADIPLPPSEARLVVDRFLLGKSLFKMEPNPNDDDDSTMFDIIMGLRAYLDPWLLEP